MSLHKFFFDDVRTSPGPDWVVARDVPEAKGILTHQAFDVMSLDHDIGMQMACDQCYAELPKPITAKTLTAFEDMLRTGCNHMEHGTQLAQWMVENLREWPRLILIHSANPYGATRMADLLRPFTQIKVVPFHALNYASIKETT